VHAHTVAVGADDAPDVNPVVFGFLTRSPGSQRVFVGEFADLGGYGTINNPDNHSLAGKTQGIGLGGAHAFQAGAVPVFRRSEVVGGRGVCPAREKRRGEEQEKAKATATEKSFHNIFPKQILQKDMGRQFVSSWSIFNFEML
jgi:hypothetical protein